MADGFEVWFTVGNVGLNDLEHFLGCFGEFDEDTVVNLEQSEELQDFSWFGSHLVDTVVSKNVNLDDDDTP